MIQEIVKHWTIPGRRRVSGLLLAICLNLAMIPCTMALEVVEQGHDCCPPEIQLDAAHCCELDDVSVDARTGTIEPCDSPDQDALTAPVVLQIPAQSRLRRVASVDPPDPPDEFPPLYDLYCVYLK